MFAGRISLDLTSTVHVDDVFVTTESLGDPATVKVTAEVTNESPGPFHGEAVIRFFQWYPEESITAAVEERIAITLGASSSETISKSVPLPRPRLWDYENPNLYKVTVTLVNKRGLALDDYVVTTGIRTISEEGG